MKDIKLLYQSAKSSGLKTDVDNYIEAVTDALKNNPYQYASNIEYIISSSYGIKTFKEFVETYGIPLISYDRIMESLDDSIKKCSYRGINSDIYTEAKQMLESFRQEYQNAFIMFEAYEGDLNISSDEYLKLYYKEYFNSNIPRVLSQFGEMAIPDVIITSIKNDKTDTVFSFLSEAVNSSEGQPKYYQWLLEVSNDIKNPSDKLKSLKQKFTKESLEGIVESIKLRNVILHKESVLMGEERYLEYSEEEIEAMKDCISFKEYYMTALDDLNHIQSIQNQVISIYEEFDGLISENESCADIVDMLPSTTVDKQVLSKQFYPGINESSSNKKSGKVPDYLRKHHDISYGEEDDNRDKNHQNDISDSYDDIKSNDYSRSTSNSSIVSDPIVKNNTVIDPKPTPDEKGRINNYYYTYNNSFNKHRRDDHSTHHNDSSLEYNVNSKNEPDIKNEYTYITTEADALITELTNTELLFSEAGTVAIMTATQGSQSEKTSFYEKLKNIIKRLWEFLENLYSRIFPKTFKDFEKLSKKFEASENIQKYAKDHNMIIPIQMIEMNNMDILGQLVKDAERFIKDGTLRFNTDYAMYQNKQSVMIYYDATHKSDGSPYGFCIVSSKNCKAAKSKFNFKDIDIIRLASAPLDQYSILNALTGKDTLDFSLSFVDFKLMLMRLKTANPLMKAISLPAKVMKDDKMIEAVESYTRMLKELTAISKYINTLMTSSYTAAVSILNKYTAVVKESSELEFTDDLFDMIIESTDDNSDPEKPESDHPIRDTLMDIDRKMTRHQQEVKKTVQDAVNVGKTFVKPAQRTAGWVNGIINQWKDKNENEIKEKMADPHARRGLYQAIRSAIITGSLFKAKLLFNPIFMFLTITKKVTNNKNQFRIRNEMIGELKAELEIIDEKIKDADSNRDTSAKYKLMRLKNELTKKLLRVDGGKKIARIL